MVSSHNIPSLLAAAATLFVSANGHMMLNTPTPYGKSTLNNSPLAADGSDFPCKQRTGVYDAEGASNVMAVGESQTLSFLGSAVHGGGSCQVSLTSDLQPTKSSKWMVIHSIEGGCPADVSGNLTPDASGTSSAKFQYSIPQGISPGDYTLAWTWVNKIGNREFYMNCAPVTVTAAKKRRYAPQPMTPKRDTSFPAMFVANLAGVSNGCATTEGIDILYPDPGTSVEKSSDGTFGPPVSCSGAVASVTAGSAGSAGSSAATSAVASSATSAVSSATTTAAASGVTVAPGVFASGTGSGSGSTSAAAVVSSSVASSSTVAAASSTVTASAAAAPSATTNGTTTTTTTGTQSGACTNEGAWSCSADGSSFQRCASGVWSASISMAAGTTCTPGVSENLAMSAAKVKRSLHAAHFRRSHHRGLGY